VDLAQHHRCAARGLQQLQHLADAARHLVDFVEENEVRDAEGFEVLEDRLEGGELFLVRLADDDRGIAGGQGGVAVKLEFDGTGTIYQCELVAEEVDFRHVEFDTHAVFARFGSGVTYAAPGFRVVAIGPGAGENGFE
jgi:hypothetical protein